MRTLTLLGVVATPVAGLALLIPRTFVATRCFRTPTFGGCSSTPESFQSMLTSAPDQIAPHLVVLAVLTVLAFSVDRALMAGGGALALASLAIAAYSFAIAGASIVLGPFLVGPLLLLVAAYAAALGASSAEVVRLLGRLALLAIGAFAAAYGFAILWGVRLGPFPIGGLEILWLYVALASAAGLAIGVVLAAADRRTALIPRGMVLGYAAFACAGLAVAFGSLPVMYPRGVYVGLGLGALWAALLWLVIANAIGVTIALWKGAGVGWRTAVLTGANLTLLAFFTGIATVAGFGPLGVISSGPPLLILPNTSTLP